MHLLSPDSVHACVDWKNGEVCPSIWVRNTTSPALLLSFFLPLLYLVVKNIHSFFFSSSSLWTPLHHLAQHTNAVIKEQIDYLDKLISSMLPMINSQVHYNISIINYYIIHSRLSIINLYRISREIHRYISVLNKAIYRCHSCYYKREQRWINLLCNKRHFFIYWRTTPLQRYTSIIPSFPSLSLPPSLYLTIII